MANEEHLRIIKQGVMAWNDWRESNPDVEPDLSSTNLHAADLSGANLINANLYRSDLSCTDLSYAYLESANLKGANLNSANLEGADLTDTTLEGANLIDASLWDATLWATNLTSASLTGAFLTNADLTQVQAVGTNFEGATLTGACIKGWNNTDANLNDVICDYVYLKRGKQERRPHTGTFAPGEFAKLFQEAHNTIDLIFREGLDWKAFAYSFKQTESQYQDAHLTIRDIGNRDNGVVIVKVAAAPDADKALIHSDFMKGYELASKTLTAQYEARLVDKDQHINQLFTLLQSSQERLGEVPKLMADMKPGDTNYYGDIKAVNFTPHGTAMGGVFNDFSNTQDLTQAAAQIQSLLAQLQQQGQSPEQAQQQVANDLAAQAKQDPTLLGKLVLWGQKLGDATITDVVKGVVKLALRSVGVQLP